MLYRVWRQVLEQVRYYSLLCFKYDNKKGLYCLAMDINEKSLHHPRKMIPTTLFTTVHITQPPIL